MDCLIERAIHKGFIQPFRLSERMVKVLEDQPYSFSSSVFKSDRLNSTLILSGKATEMDLIWSPDK